MSLASASRAHAGRARSAPTHRHGSRLPFAGTRAVTTPLSAGTRVALRSRRPRWTHDHGAGTPQPHRESLATLEGRSLCEETWT